MAKNLKFWFSTKKNKRKFISTLMQLIISIVVITAAIKAVFFSPVYVPAQIQNNTNGFYAITYFGVDLTGKPTLIDDTMLRKHLTALKQSGFETVTQKEIAEFYAAGKPLPSKALLIAFEDGRSDSALFALPILQKLNFKATMMNYAMRLIERDNKFLKAKDLLKLQKSTFFELGSNGYQFTYINVFDRYQHYLGILNQDQFRLSSSYIDNDYTHYLMGYILDEDRIPIESKTQMIERIRSDYNLMEQYYTEELGFVPAMYMIMHANSFGVDMDQDVFSANDQEIQRLFQMHFSLEGNSYNSNQTNPYSLSRLQIQPYWSTNHVLMRLQDDGASDVQFVLGDKKRSQNWYISEGEAEFKDSSIILTSKPRSKGNMRLQLEEEQQELYVSVLLEGTVLGEQGIYLEESENECVRIDVRDSVLSVTEINGDLEKVIYSNDLRLALNELAKSTAEVKRDSATAVIHVKKEKKEQVSSDLLSESTQPAKDDDIHIPQIAANENRSRSLQIRLNQDVINVNVDGIVLIQDGKLQSTKKIQAIGLEAKYSERNKSDDVYDSIFTDLLIQNGSDHTLYENRLHNIEKWTKQLYEKFQLVLDWFIRTF